MHISIIYKSTRGNIKWQRKIMEHYDIITSIIYSSLQRTPPFLSSASPSLLSLLPFFSLFLSVPFPCLLSLSFSFFVFVLAFSPAYHPLANCPLPETKKMPRTHLIK